MSETVPISVSKLDAAKRQLETAIRLYFGNEDPVSIHSLACAAFSLLDDFAKCKGLAADHSRELMMKRAKPGMEKEMRFYLKRHENFFKHADKDPDANIDFNPASSEWVLVDCVSIYFKLTKEYPPLHKAYYIWWQYSYRHLLKPEYQSMAAEFHEHQEYFASRSKFIATILPILNRPLQNLTPAAR